MRRLRKSVDILHQINTARLQNRRCHFLTKLNAPFNFIINVAILSCCSRSSAGRTTTCPQYLNARTMANVSSTRKTEQHVKHVDYESAY